MIADILVHVDGTDAGAKRIAYAFDLAARHRARLTGLHVTASADVPPYYRPSLVERVAGHIEQQAAEDAAGAEAAFKAAAARRAIEAPWQGLAGGIAADLQCRALRRPRHPRAI